MGKSPAPKTAEWAEEQVEHMSFSPEEWPTAKKLPVLNGGRAFEAGSQHVSRIPESRRASERDLPIAQLER